MNNLNTVRFGIIGCGLMGREFASAAARWCHLVDTDARPEIVAICNRSDKPFAWFQESCPTIYQVTHDYAELIANPDVDAVYIAVPHDKHLEYYCAAIEADKHLMGEKPFGIDLGANSAVLDCIAQHPDVLVRCSSEFPFFPAIQRIGAIIESGGLGRIIEVEAGFLHSSDMDPNKPINWKRMIRINGRYGCMGDLGMHVCHLPFRAGWFPRNVRAVLSDIVTERPNGSGQKVPCETWDNATLLCETVDSQTGDLFPMTLKTQRIAPGEKNTFYIKILGTKTSVRFSTKNPKRLEVLDYSNGSQIWGQVDMGHETAYPTITGGIFEFGFSDAMLQMWAAYLHELQHGRAASKFAGCVTPEETARSHRLFTAAMDSHTESSVVEVD